MRVTPGDMNKVLRKGQLGGAWHPTLNPPLPPFPAPTPGNGDWAWGCNSERTELVQQVLSATQLLCIWWQFLNSAHSPGRPCWPLSKLQQKASSAGLCLGHTGVAGCLLEPLRSERAVLWSWAEDLGLRGWPHSTWRATI